MVLRTARRGKNAGGQFWGCTAYPKCKGIVSFVDVENQKNEDVKSVHRDGAGLSSYQSEPVHWRDSFPRGDYYSEYVNIGAVPGFVAGKVNLADGSASRAASQTLLLSKRYHPDEVSDDEKAISSVLQKLITRGALPLSTLRVEETVIRTCKLAQNVSGMDDKNSEVGWEWVSKLPRGLTREIIDAFSCRAKLSGENVTTLADITLVNVLDGENERHFFENWLTRVIGKDLLHWVTPQAELDLILASSGLQQSGQRKIDFLYSHPTGGTIAIELDGEDHDSKVRSDASRNADLILAGIKTFRIPNKELEIGEGPHLLQLERALREAHPLHDVNAPTGISLSILAASVAARFQFILARALSAGQLRLESGSWNIGIRSDLIEMAVFQAAADDLSEMITSLATLYIQEPIELAIQCHAHSEKTGDQDLTVAALVMESPISVNLLHLADDYVFCPAWAPVSFATDVHKVATRTRLLCNEDHRINVALSFFLQNLFRKRAFRELQVDAVKNALKGQDTVTLLPTGAGKSIIYQLAGLLQTGLTIVVDPIVALIEDQIQGLARVGIDKAGAPPSGLNRTDERQKWLRAVERGDFQFILMSPERLQMTETREALRALAEVTFINLAVIDEAHCVSDWGHNFRFSYLNLADNLRKYCMAPDGSGPTLLALTGTASRSVLRELLTELKIGKDNSDALIRPLNFDRNELKFHITKVASGGDTSAILRGILNGLPAKFNVPPGEFFLPAGSRTNSGVVFTPFVNGRSHGLFAVKSAIKNALNVPVTAYSGSAPKGVNALAWDSEKRANAQSFKDNASPVLVATKAFGMGIDKPNIRWTVHMGVPSSMEAFYQEAGRAGRDKRLAYCSLIFSEVDPEATDKALSGQGTLDELRQAAKSFKNNNDDISRALFFHLNAYSGVEEEIQEVADVLLLIGDLNVRKNVEVPFNRETRPSVERAILRLIKSGIVDDLEVNYGSGYFTLQVPSFDFDSARRQIEQYISDAQPARLKTIIQELDQVETVDLIQQPARLCELMINFTYDVIERSRRRMLYEAILLGRNYSQDSEIRQYLLDYLQEGLGAEQIAQLAEQKEIDFDAWIALFEQISTPLDAGEIRGIIIRLLETFPDHPGMLAARGIAEALVGRPDEILVRDSLLASLDSGHSRYSCSREQITSFLFSLVELAHTKSVHLRLPLMNAIQRSSAISDDDRLDLRQKVTVYSASWDDKSKLCVSVISADDIIRNSLRGAQLAVSHFADFNKKLN